jgi:hypothetical protein
LLLLLLMFYFSRPSKFLILICEFRSHLALPSVNIFFI